MSTQVLLLVGMILGLLLIVFLLVVARFGRLWIQSVLNNAGIGLFDLIAMSLRKVNAETIVQARIMAVRAKINLTARQAEAHYLARGNLPRVIRALISASRADIPLDFRRAAAIDLAGRNVEEAVQTSVNPKIIDVPDQSKGRMTIDAVAKDGIQLKTKARVTVRTNIEQLIGGATEETIVARVGEGIVSTIGSSETYMDVLEHPNMISRTVLKKGLDAGTAFEILSIDIAEIEVGDNVGARLQVDQAEADTRKARAQAEIRRAQAVAREHEMRARVQENRATVVLAEAEVPKSIAKAFRTGRIKEMLASPPSSGNGMS